MASCAYLVRRILLHQTLIGAADGTQHEAADVELAMRLTAPRLVQCIPRDGEVTSSRGVRSESALGWDLASRRYCAACAYDAR